MKLLFRRALCRDRVPAALTSRGYALVAVASLAFGSLAVLAKLAYAEGMSVPDLLFWRFTLASVVIAPLALRRLPSARALVPAIVLGIFGYGLTTIFYFNALKTPLPAGVASFLLYLAPAFVAVGGWLLYRERLGSRGRVALTLALVGLALLTLAPDAPLPGGGVLLATLSAVTYSGTILGGRAVGAKLTAAQVTLGTSIGAALTHLATARGRIHFPPTTAAWAETLAIALLCTAFAVLAFYAGLREIGAQRTAIVATIEPVATAAIGAVVLAETMSSLQLAGGLAVIVASVVLATESPAARAE